MNQVDSSGDEGVFTVCQFCGKQLRFPRRQGYSELTPPLCRDCRTSQDVNDQYLEQLKTVNEIDFSDLDTRGVI